MTDHDNLTPIWPTELRPGMTIVEGRVSIHVKDVGPCDFQQKGHGKTHVNGAFCYDNSVKVTIRA